MSDGSDKSDKSDESDGSAKVRAWCELLRVPNLFTVPGDPLAGALLAGAVPGVHAGRLVAAAAASTLLYAAGLVWNDVADFETDRRERPGRPLPSGRIPVRSAVGTATGFSIAGLMAAGLAGPIAAGVAMILLGLVLFYNFAAKANRLVGSVVMGLCRGFSVLLGAAAALPAVGAGQLPVAAAAAAGVAAYIAAVSWVAAHEVVPGARAGVARGLPLVVVAGCGLMWLGARLPAGWGIAVLWGLGLGNVAWYAHRAGGPPGSVPPAIGGWIRALVLLQAGLCATVPGGAQVAILLGGFFLLAVHLARRYAAS